MRIALLKESRPGETRVALTPDVVKALVADGWQVAVERGAGTLSHYSDAAYELAGGTRARRFRAPVVSFAVAGPGRGKGVERSSGDDFVV